MFLTSYNYGIRLIDLVDYTNSNTTFSDVCNKVNDLLTSNCREEFYVDNNDLWNDFIKRFTRRFMYRTLSFDTYLNFCIKLNDVLTSNKVKLNNMYKAKLIEFNPLYNKYITTDIDNENNKTGTKKTDRKENGNTTRNENGNTTRNENGKNNKKSIGSSIEKTTRTDNLHTTDNTKNNGTEYNLHSDSPRSSVSVDDMFKTNNNYITDAQNKKTNSRNNTTGTQTGTVKNDGNVKNNNNENGSFNTNSTDKSVFNSTDKSVFNSNILSTDNIKDTLVGKQLLYGYDGNPTDLLKKYINFVIDTNEYLLNKIEEECLFMNIII